MSNHRISRITEDMKREISTILRELKDPRIQTHLLSVVRVEVSNDLSYCKVYISAIEGLAVAQAALKALKAAAGYIRHELGMRLTIRHIPELIFYATDSIEYGANISKILKELKEESHGN